MISGSSLKGKLYRLIVMYWFSEVIGFVLFLDISGRNQQIYPTITITTITIIMVTEIVIVIVIIMVIRITYIPRILVTIPPMQRTNQQHYQPQYPFKISAQNCFICCFNSSTWMTWRLSRVLKINYQNC